MRTVSDVELKQASDNIEYLKIISSAVRPYKRTIKSDFAHMTQLILWEALRGHDPEKSKFTSYLHNCAVWHCKKYCKEQKKRRNIDKMEVSDLYIGLRVDESFHSNILVEMDGILNSEDYSLMVEKYINRKTLREIGEELHISQQAVHQRIKKIRQKLQSTLT